MQPAYIRLIDNLRKQLETSNWRGTYRDVSVWADDISDETKATVAQLRTRLETASPDEAATIEQTLSQLPSPYPGYELCLQNGDRQVTVDLWELCYKICFRFGETGVNDDPAGISAEADRPVEIDTDLLEETGDVDWNRLEDKTKRLVSEIFDHLPS